MAGMGRTIASLSKHRRAWAKLLAAAETKTGRAEIPAQPSRLRETTGFGANPGNLRMLTYVPEALPDRPALVVVLHGCTQTAAGYDYGTGWSTLADRYGFALLLPEQQRANNPKACFNWFRPGDIERGRGEASSIREMVERAVRDHRLDRARIFVTGLSAGGAMTSVMLATYPEMFAGGAIVAGLPYRAAKGVPEALDAMFQGRTRSAQEWGDLVRAASPHRGPWPKVSVWHGSADATVTPMNAGEIIKQWTDVHGVPPAAAHEETVDGYPRRVWRNAGGEEIIEEYTIAGMAHGAPLATGDGEEHFGAAGPFLLEVGISSSYHIAKFWGLTGTRVEATAADTTENSLGETVNGVSSRDIEILPPPHLDAGGAGEEIRAGRQGSRRNGRRPQPIDVGAVITNALKAAGLMK